MENLFEGKTVLITGGTGYLGRNLTRHILKQNPHSVRVFSRDEVKHHKMAEEFKDERVRNFVGDVRDTKRISKAMTNADIVIHAAAMKRIDLVEYNVFEAIKTNVIGTMNVIDACIEHEVEKAVLISTDKACSPVNSYGATKMLGERAFIESNYNKGKCPTIFTAVRYGNVAGSTGSVIPFFIEKIKNGEEVPITDSRMTRFFITAEQAVAQVSKAIRYGIGGEIFIPKLPSFKIIDLVEVLKEHYDSDSKIKIIGIRPGEKIDEWLVNNEEAARTYGFNGGFTIISQIDQYQTVKYDYLAKKQKVGFKYYSSRDALVEKPKIKELLLSAGMI